MKPLMICAAVTGGAPPKSKTPHHPVTPAETAEAAIDCWRAGAAIVHYHARLEDGETTTDPQAYERIAEIVRASGSDVILNASGGDDGGRASHAQRLAVADLGVEMVSLEAGSFDLGNRLYDNRPSHVREIAGRLTKNGMKAEVEIFSPGHLDVVTAIAAEGLLKAPHHIQFVFGLPGTMPVDLRMMPLLIDRLPPNSEWAIAVPGAPDHETYIRMLMYAFTHGGHFRTGFEDCVYLRPGELAKSNAEMVEQWVKTAEIWGRPVASPNDAREMLGIKKTAHT